MGGELGGVPLLMVLLIPMVSLSVCDNYLESTMSVFVLVAVWCILHERGWWWPLMGGVCLVAAFLTKGFTGLFPLALPFLVWVFRVRQYGFWRMVADTGFALLGLIVPMMVVWFSCSDAAVFMTKYFDHQVVDGIRLGVTSRSYIAVKLVEAMVIPLVLTTFTVMYPVVRKTDRWSVTGYQWRVFGVMFAMALCGSLPMMVSTKQRAFYLITVFPYVAISMAALMESFIKYVVGLIKTRWLSVVTGLLFVCAVVMNIANANKPGRDGVVIADMDVIAEAIGDGRTVTVPSALRQQWNLQGYWYFYHNVSLDAHNQHDFLLTTKGVGASEWEGEYRLVELPTKEYKLYELR